MADTGTETELEDQENTEITLGTGKLLGIFFGLVLLCSLFFTMGYMMGRSNAAGSKTEIVGSESTGTSPAGKPSAADKTPAPAPVTVTSSSGTQPASSTAPTPAPAGSTTNAPAALVPASSSGSADSTGNAAVSYLVQVAAVSKRDDADVLVSQLQKKQYPAFVANNSGDAFFHVLVGPLTDPKEAETMRSRLAADGYNAIVKTK